MSHLGHTLKYKFTSPNILNIILYELRLGKYRFLKKDGLYHHQFCSTAKPFLEMYMVDFTTIFIGPHWDLKKHFRNVASLGQTLFLICSLIAVFQEGAAVLTFQGHGLLVMICDHMSGFRTVTQTSRITTASKSCLLTFGL